MLFKLAGLCQVQLEICSFLSGKTPFLGSDRGYINLTILGQGEKTLNKRSKLSEKPRRQYARKTG